MIFENARLIDPENGTEVLGWLAVANGAIKGVGEGAAPEGVGQRIDCGGKCLAPGIVEFPGLLSQASREIADVAL